MSKTERSHRTIGETTKFNRQDLKAVRRGDTRCVPMFLIIRGPQKGRPLPLPEGQWTMGRGPQSDLSVLGRGISRLHLRIDSHTDGTVEVQDTDSTNGLLVNGQWVHQHTFAVDDILQIGTEVELKFALLPATSLDLQLRIYGQSIIDELTGLHNRRYLLNSMHQSLSYAHRHGKPLCLLIVDIDHFKCINDKHGHLVGDMILEKFATLLISTLRAEDICARIGGEEFALLLHGMGVENCINAAERMRISIASHAFICNELRMGCTASIGGAMLPEGKKMAPQSLLKLADVNLYKAKNGGRNCTIFS